MILPLFWILISSCAFPTLIDCLVVPHRTSASILLLFFACILRSIYYFACFFTSLVNYFLVMPSWVTACFLETNLPLIRSLLSANFFRFVYLTRYVESSGSYLQWCFFIQYRRIASLFCFKKVSFRYLGDPLTKNSSFISGEESLQLRPRLTEFVYI